jgi:hypothetical protein
LNQSFGERFQGDHHGQAVGKHVQGFLLASDGGITAISAMGQLDADLFQGVAHGQQLGGEFLIGAHGQSSMMRRGR